VPGIVGHFFQHVAEIILKRLADLIDSRAAIKQYLARRAVLKQRKKEMLERHEFVTVADGFVNREA
jgi:hypothetical protein